MSVYNETVEDDIDISFSDKEVTIYAGYDEAGSMYIYLSFDQIKEIYEKTISGRKEDS